MPGIVCVVQGCKSRQKDEPSPKFFRIFRKNKSQTEEWIKALSKVNRDGWTAKSSNRICSVHFLSGEPSNDPLSPSYIPTFVTGHLRAKSLADQDRQNRRTSRLEKEFRIKMETEAAASKKPVKPVKITRDVPSWTGPLFTKDKATMTDAFSNPITIRVLKNEAKCRAVCGIPLAVFKQTMLMLEGTLKPSRSLSKEDQLVLYFSKLKTSDTFSALAVYFDVCDKTVSRVFYDVLEEHHKVAMELMQCQNSASVPVNSTKVVMHTIEIKVDNPTKVDAQDSSQNAKFMIGIGPDGKITFLSRAFGGKMMGEVHNLLQPNDTLIADDEQEMDVSNGNIQGNQVNDHKYRFHVERTLQWFRIFRVLKYVDHHMLKHVDKILLVLAFVCNNLVTHSNVASAAEELERDVAIDIKDDMIDMFVKKE